MGESAEDDGVEALPVGATIGGYAIRRVIGHGGFGITYEAHNRVTGRAVAIKEFFPASMVRRDGRSRLVYSKANAETIVWALRKFEETTTTLCALEHPNIVRVHDYVPANDTGYMVMEFLDGQTLKDWLKGRPAPPGLDELRPLVDPVMEALAYVHGRGLIHRDIAPDNILITRDGRPVLIDFGSVSRDLSDAKQLNLSSTIGLTKRHYTAPEQMRAKARPTPAADIYSMGAVLYRALSGSEPTDGQERVDALFHGREADPYKPLTALRPRDCPARAMQAIDKALAIRPEHRPRSMAELYEALKPAPTSKPPRAKQPRETPSFAKLSRPVALLAAGVVIVGAAGGLWLATSGHRTDLGQGGGESEGGGTIAAPGGGDLIKLIAETPPQKGEQAAKICGACHNFKEGEGTKVGPDLYGIVDRDKGSVVGFDYSSGLRAKGGTWTYQDLDAWLTNPSRYIPGTTMGYAGEADERKRAAIIAYLRSLAESPAPLPVEDGAPAQRSDRRAEAHLAPPAGGSTGLLDCTTTPAKASEIIGAGAIFPYPIYAKWAETYAKASGVRLSYQAIGSGAGIKQIEARTVAFGASDLPLDAAQLEQASLAQWPMVLGAVVPVVNIEGIGRAGLTLDGPTLAKIYLGDITTWDDPAIRKLNASVRLPSSSINVVHRSDSSGKTLNLTQYLSKTSAAWKSRVGAAVSVQWPTGIGAKGNEGVAANVRQTASSIGYVDFAYARQSDLAPVAIVNRDGGRVEATPESIAAAAANADWEATPGFGPALTDQPGIESWPITDATFALMQTKSRDADTAGAALRFFAWAYQNGDAAAAALGYVPVPKAVAALVERTWPRDITDAGGNPLQVCSP